MEWYKTTLQPGWTIPKHIVFLCSIVQKMIDGELMRVAISTPPGHAKSDTITRRLPNFWGPRHPKDAIVLTGYNQRFAEKNLSYHARELARDMGTLASTATALDEWEFNNGARVIARGVNNAPTGVNPISLLIADDPISSRAQASSEVERENIWQWWLGSINQRFWPNTRALVIATRWHEDDLIGRLKATNDGSWTFINLPAIAEEDDPMGRLPGEALWPEQKPIEFLHKQRSVSQYEFEALFQGNPTPREGSFFKVAQLQIVDAVPAGMKAVRRWDIGATENDGDYTVGVRMEGPHEGIYYVTDVVRGQWATHERDSIIRQTAQLDGMKVKQGLPQDPGAAGKSQAAAFVRLLAGFPVTCSPVSGDKETRADPCSSQVNAGNVRLVKGDWNKAFIEELRQFPGGKHDDIVDAFADAFNDLATPNTHMNAVEFLKMQTPPAA